MLTNFKDEDFDSKIKNEDISVIQFSAEWCGPCKALKPVMDKLSDEYKDKAGFYYADVEDGGINTGSAADLTGEIVGEEIDPLRKEPILRNLDGNQKKWMAAGDFEIIELNRQLNLQIPESINYYTLAGFLLEKFQQVPIRGQTLLENGILFEISSMQGPRIDRVKIIFQKKLPKEVP